MGTRNLTCVWHEKKYKVAQYCQWDGYPGGQGITVLKFLKEDFDREKFIKNLDKCRYPSEKKIKQMWVDCGADPKNDWVNLEISEKFKQKYATLQRDMGAAVLYEIQKHPVDLQLSTDFANDSLWCEWCYVIDLDKNMLEVYEGFNKRPLSEKTEERFLKIDSKPDGSGYYPVRLKEKWPIDNLPDEDEFVEILEPIDDEDDE